MPIDTQNERMSIMGWESYALPLANSAFDKEDRMMVLGLPSVDLVSGAISVLSTSPPTIGVEVTSTIGIAPLIALLADDYFTSLGDFSRIDIVYRHEGNRQEKRIVHNLSGLDFVGRATWSSYARLGLWRKTTVRARNHEGAVAEASITGEDFTLV